MSLVMNQLVAHAECEHWEGFKHIAFAGYVDVVGVISVLFLCSLGIQTSQGHAYGVQAHRLPLAYALLHAAEKHAKLKVSRQKCDTLKL